MKSKAFKTLAVFALILASCASMGSGKGLSLADAIEQTGEKIAGELPRGSRVAIVAFESANDNISDYIMEELTGALFDRKIEVADRQNLDYVYKELNLQMSGNVSNESAKSIGKFLAADMVITGQLIDLDGVYRYRTSAINVETAVRASVTRLDVRSDAATQRMMTALVNQKTTVKTAKYGVSEKAAPQTAGTFLDRGILFASRGDFDMAISDFTEAIKLNPNMSAAYMLRGKALFASVSEISNIDNNFGFEFYTNLEITAEQTRVYDRAIADFNNALRLDPNNARIYHERGNAYNTKGDKDRAIADYTQAIQIDPNFANAYYNRGFVYFYRRNSGDIDRAIADCTKAIQIDPSYVHAYYTRGLAYHDVSLPSGDIDRAISDYSQTIQLDPNYILAYFGRGTAYLMRYLMRRNNGDIDRAIADFETCLRLDPNYTAAREMLDDARRARGR